MSGDAHQRYKYVFGPAEFDEARGELRINRKPVKLQPKPLKLLRLLLARREEVVDREEIRRQVWAAKDDVDDASIAIAVRRLRVALGDTKRELIVTAPKSGYRLGGVLRRVALGHGYAVQSTAELRVTIQRAFSELRELDAAIEHGEHAVEAAVLAGGPLSELALDARLQLAADLARGGRHRQAEALLAEIRADLAADSASRPLDWARWWWVQSDLEAFQVTLEASLASAESAVRFLAQGSAPGARLVDGVRTRLGKALRMVGRLRDSERVLVRLADIQRKRDGAGAETVQLTCLELARTFMLQQRTDAAMKFAQEAFEQLTTSLGPYSLPTQWAKDAIASIQFKRQDYAEAEASWQEVADALARQSPHPNDFRVTAQANIALARLYLDRPRESEAAGRLALALSEPLHAPNSPRVQSIRFQLAFALLEQLKAEGVKALLDGLDPEALKQAVQADDWEGKIIYLRGRLALLEGRFEEACTLLQEAQRRLASIDERSIFAPSQVRHWLAKARTARSRSSPSG